MYISAHCIKMAADSLTENPPYAPEFICPSPKVLNFSEKRLHWTTFFKKYTVQSRFSDILFSDKSRFSDNFDEDHFFST